MIIGLIVLAVLLFLLIFVSVVDMLQEWNFISMFFRYRLWRKGTIEIQEGDWWTMGETIPLVRVSEDLSIGVGSHVYSLFFVFDMSVYDHVQLHWISSPVSYTCMMIMRRVHYPQLKEAQQLMDL